MKTSEAAAVKQTIEEYLGALDKELAHDVAADAREIILRYQRENLHDFASIVGDAGPAQLSRQHLVRYAAILNNRGTDKSTKDVAIADVREFLQWLERRGKQPRKTNQLPIRLQMKKRIYMTIVELAVGAVLMLIDMRLFWLFMFASLLWVAGNIINMVQITDLNLWTQIQAIHKKLDITPGEISVVHDPLRKDMSKAIYQKLCIIWNHTSARIWRKSVNPGAGQ
jgi:site-specific recombinase XerC